MKKIIFLFIFLQFFIFNVYAFNDNARPKLFLFLGSDKASEHENQLNKACVYGSQIIYSWKELEPKKDIYDFSKIEADLQFLSSIHKKLFIQIQDRSFSPHIFNVPDYLRQDKIYHGGVAKQYDFPGEGKPMTSGWVARVWDPLVAARFQLLIQRLAAQFDGRIEGINLPETAVDFDIDHPPQGFSFDNYFYAELYNISMVRKAFSKSLVIQYINFFPGEWNNDHHYLSRFFAYAIQNQIGLGGPDVIPYRKAYMKNTFPFFHQFRENLLTAMAIQEPDYTYKDPKTGDYYDFFDFYHFSTDYLGAKILFWNIQEPFFTYQLAPRINSQYFICIK